MRRTILALPVFILFGLVASISHAAEFPDVNKLSGAEKETLRKGISDRTGRKMQLFGNRWLLISNHSASGSGNLLLLMNFSESGKASINFSCQGNKLQIGFRGNFVRSGNFMDSLTRGLPGASLANIVFIDYDDAYIESRLKAAPNLTRSQFTDDRKPHVIQRPFIKMDDTFIIDNSSRDYMQDLIWEMQMYKTLVIAMNSSDEEVFNIENGVSLFKALEPLQKECGTNYKSVYDTK